MTSPVDTTASARPLRLLVVDDDELDRRTVRRALRQAGVAAVFEEAGSAAEAVERLRPGSHDCVLLDYYLPGTDPAELLHRLREAAGDVPVVVFTGRGDELIAVDSMKAGAVDYLPKAALTPERLVSSLRYAQTMARAAAARRRAEDERQEAERALREREQEFRTLANAIPQLAWISDLEGRRYWFNERWYEYTGLRPHQSLGLGWWVVHHPDRRDEIVERQLAAFRGCEAWEETVYLRRHDGTYRWFLARAMPIRDESGAVLRWIGTDTDVTAQREASLEREELLTREQRARDEAERASRARDEMLAVVAHDLRSPVQTIVAAARMLTDGGEDESRRRQLATVVERSTREMDRLISDLLDVAQIEAGTLPLERQRVDVRRLVAEALEQIEPQAAVRRIAFEAELDEGLPPVEGDRDRLIQVMSNLLGNALKFTPEGRGVAVRAQAVGGAVQVTIADQGSGIDPEALPHVFDRFWQASRASRAGAGLGLAICKGIVEAHGGRIWADSALGRGTTMSFTLPLPAA
ncbi:MAG TPA: ATP-binding protein [Solirubrobacterales bacterium]|nr:ATP-binding protein [Solirubrobacterales bacterium]